SNNRDLFLDFNSGTVVSLTINDKPVTQPVYDTNTITLPARSLVAGTNHVSIMFSHAYGENHLGLLRYQDPLDSKTYVYTAGGSEFARYVFPCFDQSDITSSLNLVLQTPADWRVITQGKADVVSLPNKTNRFWAFRSSQPAVVSSFVLIAGPFEQWQKDHNQLSMRLFVRASLADKIKPVEWFSPIKLGMAFYQNYFKTPYPHNKIDQVFLPEQVSQEGHSALLVMSDASLSSQRRVQVRSLLNKMAHQWLAPNITTASTRDLWLVDGYAQYSAGLAADQIDRLASQQAQALPTNARPEPPVNTTGLDTTLTPQGDDTNFYSYLKTLTPTATRESVSTLASNTAATTCSQERLEQLDRFITNNPRLPGVMKTHFLSAKQQYELCLNKRGE
ncbi:MAG: membrane alanyl aminopeptidase, partial [uncultured bacterium]